MTFGIPQIQGKLTLVTTIRALAWAGSADQVVEKYLNSRVARAEMGDSAGPQKMVVDVFEEPLDLANLRILMLNMDPDERLPDNSEVGCSCSCQSL